MKLFARLNLYEHASPWHGRYYYDVATGEIRTCLLGLNLILYAAFYLRDWTACLRPGRFTKRINAEVKRVLDERARVSRDKFYGQVHVNLEKNRRP